ncbi:histidine ammonia-lyase [Streptomyces sp. NPDC127068]|uniref:HAL/PAL/TAL family ammonia-lyase n=1 Tax=Streptomyces sp. NPDC127068 TaxID=3347127 RepID=UPI003661959E
MSSRSERIDDSTADVIAANLDGHSLTLRDVADVARTPHAVRVALSARAEAAMARSVATRNHLIESGTPVYGATTGFGDSSNRRIGSPSMAELQRNMMRFMQVGTGAPAPGEVVRATMLIRANCLARGCSGIRPEPVRLLMKLIELNILPVIPERGSVGASGDLAPLAHLGAVLAGEGEVVHQGVRQPAAEALKACGLRPVELEAKEGLALINGTSFMAAFAVLAAVDSRRLVFAVELCTALLVRARHGRPEEFSAFPHDQKPHPGQMTSATAVRTLLQGDGQHPVPCGAASEARFDDPGFEDLERRLQEPYSVRCAPHVNGVLRDTLSWVEQWLTVEINSANDNPLFDATTQSVHNSGNFYGGHVAQAMDSLKIAVASTADLLDRQLQLIVDEKYNRGLPANLVAHQHFSGDRAGLHHGFKGMQIAASALTAEALHLTTPASAFSRSTEAHNQDKVSMGTIAARHARRVVDLALNTAAIHVIALCQAVELRGEALSPTLRAVHELVRRHVPFAEADRPLHGDIASVTEIIRGGLLEQAVQTDSA